MMSSSVGSALLSVLIILLQLTATTFADSTTIEITNQNHHDNNNNSILTTLSARTNRTTQTLTQKSAEYSQLQSLYSEKMARLSERQSLLQAELSKYHDVTQDSISSAGGAMHDDMDRVSLKLVELLQRTEVAAKTVANWNKEEYLTKLKARLVAIQAEEMERRDRFAALLSESEDTNNNNDDEDEVPTSPTYITKSELNQLLSAENILTPTEKQLKSKLMAMAINLMEQRDNNDAKFWARHFETLPQQIQQLVDRLFNQSVNNVNSNDGGGCIDIPSAVQLVANALTSYYEDGGVGMSDVASYETGGSVVYELTSGPYQPPPRNGGYGGATTTTFDEDDDKVMERMYHDQQSDMMTRRDNHDGIAQRIDAELDKVDIWTWYTTFQLDSIRQYLPDDWERALDHLSDAGYLPNWGEYTPRGIVDALIPDYIYHAFGVSNTASYGSVYGRTAGPEVAITAGRSKTGGSGGVNYSPKALGNCYPISMDLENDPVLSLMARYSATNESVENDEDEDGAANNYLSSLVGPKYTVRLPYPIHIDAVSLEHRAFPLPQNVLNNGVKGGESAPRWVKVVGFPPCGADGNDEDECDKLGFVISQPIELGSFEYYPVTVSGREDDYGQGDEDDSEEAERRRRSIQTFTVKGGRANGTDVEESVTTGDEEPEQLELEDYEIPAGSCAPPKEPDDVPSCDGDVSSSDDGERQVVSAVTFVIQENWGNNDYTCLYRVRVHGDPLLD